MASRLSSDQKAFLLWFRGNIYLANKGFSMKKFLCKECAALNSYCLDRKHFSHSGYCEVCGSSNKEVAFFDDFDKVVGKPVATKRNVASFGKVKKENILGTVREDLEKEVTEKEETIKVLLEQIEGDSARLHTANQIIKDMLANSVAMRQMAESLNIVIKRNKESRGKAGGCGGGCGGK